MDGARDDHNEQMGSDRGWRRWLTLIRWSKLTFFVLSLGAGLLFQSGGLITISACLLLMITFERQLDIRIPAGIEVFFVSFIVASLVLGSSHDFYERFWWWDDVLHILYGGAFAVIGFLVIQYLSRQRGIANETLVVCLFSFCFAVAGGALWEIWEFGYDSVTGGNMQRTQIGRGVNDTMHDLIVETASAFVVNLFIYAYIKSGARNWVGRLSESFLRLNETGTRPRDADGH